MNAKAVITACTEHLVPGMVLARDVMGADESLLRARGHALTEADIELFAQMRLPSVHVSTKSVADLDQWLLASTQEHVRRFFVYVDSDNPYFEELYRLCVRRVLTLRAAGKPIACAEEIAASSVEHLADVFFRSDLTLDKLVLHETELASFPDIYFRLKEILDNPLSSAKDIAAVVSTDVALAGKLLKLVNSPLFGLSARVDTIERAVSLVGAKELSTLALGITAISFFKDIPPELVNMKTFWRHSLSCGIFAKLIATRTKLPAERMFIAGLLHDAGRLVLFKDQPYASTQALLFARSNFLPLMEAEQEIFGFDHAAVGGRLLEAWAFPQSLSALVAGHHAPMEAAVPAAAAAVQLADILANAAAIGTTGLFVLPPMDEAAMSASGIAPGDLKNILADHDALIAELAIALL